MFRPILGHLQGVSFSLESEEFDEKICYIDDEISYIFTLAFLWRVYVGGYYGWVGSVRVLYRSL
jgi:hypothetical protein